MSIIGSTLAGCLRALSAPKHHTSLIGIALLLGLCASSQANELDDFSDILTYALPLTAFSAPYWQDDPLGQTQFIHFAVISSALSTGLAMAIDRSAPNGQRYSLPSGSASAAFIGAGFLYQRYGWRAGVPALIGAALVGYSQVDRRQAHASDVLASAALVALIASWQVTSIHESLQLGIASQGIGLSLSWTP